MKLDGKVALITGAASGIGRAGALLFAKEGSTVAVVDINEKGGQNTVFDIQQAHGKACYIRADTGVLSEVRKMVEETVKRYGRLDIFWHNAGPGGPRGFEDTNEAEYDEFMNIHLKGGFFGIQAAIPQLRKTGGGSILITASISGLKAWSPSAAYACAKAALVNLTKWLAAYYAKDNIRVNCLCPGVIRTGAWQIAERDTAVQEMFDDMMTATPMNRAGTSEEVAASALFLVSADASYITGETLCVDGGSYAYARPRTGSL